MDKKEKPKKEAKPTPSKKEPTYQLTIFKLIGHNDWKVTLERNPTNLIPKIAEKKVILIDRLTGEIVQE